VGVARACLIAWAVLLAACGRPPDVILTAVSAGVDRIHSGVLELQLSLTLDAAPRQTVGFRIHGPFEVRGGRVDADLAYRRFAGTAVAEVRFVTAEGRSFVETDGTVYELPQGNGAKAKAPTVLQDLGFEEWAVEPRVLGVGGGHVTIVSALEEMRAVQGIHRLLRDLEMEAASGLAVLGRVEGEALRRALDGGMLAALVGPDGLLRALVVGLRFEHVPSPAGGPLREIGGADLVLSVEIAEPNEAVVVRVPAGARPLAEQPAP
jgi:hypothetical protein